MTLPATGASPTTNATNNVTINMTKPADNVAGELSLCFIGIRSTMSIATVPANWTALLATLGSSTAHQRSYRHEYLAGDPATFQWTQNAAERYAAVMLTITGADMSGTNGASAIHVTADTNGANSLVAPAVTTTVSDCLIIHAWTVFHNAFGSTATCTNPAGTTSVALGATVNTACRVAYENQVSPGTTLTRTATTNTAQGQTASTIAIAPPAGGPAPVVSRILLLGTG